MRQMRKLLALAYESKLGLRDIARLTGVSKTTISEYLVRFRRTGLSYQESLELSDGELLSLFEKKKQEESEQYSRPVNSDLKVPLGVLQFRFLM